MKKFNEIIVANKKYNFSLVIPTTNRDGVTVTHVERNEQYTLESSIENGGFSNEQSVFNFVGIFNTKRKIQVATVVIDPASGNKILGTPTINIEKLYRGTKIDDDTNVEVVLTDTANTYKLFYSSKSVIPEGIRFILSYSEIINVAKNDEITRVSFGGTTIKQSGERRNITVIGTPYTPFELTLVDSDNNSTLPTSVANSTTILNTGEEVPSISSSTDSNGRYSFIYNFPRTPRIIKTAINGSMAASGATKIIFDDLTGVEVGDKLYMKQIPTGKCIKVITLNPDGDNVNECTVSESITAADDAPVQFRRSTFYNLNITSTSTLNSSIPTTYPTYTLNQFSDTLVKLRLKKTPTDYTVSDGTTTGGASDTTFDYCFYGAANYSVNSRAIRRSRYSNSQENNVSFQFVLDGVGVKTLSITKQPTKGDFTNIDPTKNGGNEIRITNLKAVSSAGGGIVTLFINFYIYKFGTEDVTVELDLDTIVS